MRPRRSHRGGRRFESVIAHHDSTWRSHERVMAENFEVLDFVRARFPRQEERFDRVERKLDDVITRLAAVERDIAGLHGDFAGLKVDFASMQSRLDSMD